MKIIRGLNYFFVVALGFFAVMFAIDRFGNRSAQAPADTVLYTEEYCKDIIGYHSYIPLEIKMEDGKIAEINILDNDETPRFMRKVTDESLVEKFYGLTPAEAMVIEVDAVSGATFSSNAIIQSVKRRMEIYNDTVNPSPWTWQLMGIICCAVVLGFLSFLKKRS